MKMADISPVVGRSFVCSTGRVFKATRMAEGAIMVDCGSTHPTQKEQDEFEEFCASVVGSKNSLSVLSNSPEEAMEDHREFLQLLKRLEEDAKPHE